LKSCLLLLILFVVTPCALGQTTPPKDFDSFVDNVRKTFEVPGISVAIVKDGKVVLAKGYGLKKLGTDDKVDSKTNFGIASNTKAFTATALGLLVEEHKIAWDAAVIDYLPWFQLSDPYVTREMTVRDLLVHRSGLGLGAGDLLWWPTSTYDRKEIARRLRHIPLATSFRSAYAYDNVLYLIAGELIESVSGLPWEDFVQKRILDKVGMSNSNVRHSDANRKGNVATPHAPINGQVRPITAFDSDNTNPAGGINSNAEDMAKWLICQLDSGKTAGGERLFSPSVTRQLWNIVTPRTPGATVPPQLAPIKANFQGYALGFDVRDYRGKKLVTHTGGLPGYVSRVAMIPELRVGVAVLTNQESGEAFDAVAYTVLDHFLGAQFDYLNGFRWLKRVNDSTTAVAEAKIGGRRDSLSQPSLPLAKYAGLYTDTWYGDVRIDHKDGKLSIQMVPTPSLGGMLEHFQYNTFIARWSDPEMRADAFVTFSLNPDGTIESAKMRAVSPATDFSFDFQDLLLKPAKQR
jgi:CubicO group peptidase (beta-lactamase class C family)